MTELSGWGGYPKIDAHLITPKRVDEILGELNGAGVMRGQGRSYGDAAILSNGVVVQTEHLARLLHFDEERGVLTAEAGMTLADILRLVVPRGWFPAVVPGTKFVSLGGSVAADIHGKNHHRDGPFSDHVKQLKLLLADGRYESCSPSQNSELFWATVGGMGLTGIIAEVQIQLVRIDNSHLIVRHHQSRDLDQSIEFLDRNDLDDQYTVLWLDCLAGKGRLGRGILITGHHARTDELPKKLPTNRERSFQLNSYAPAWLLNPMTVGTFNEVYYRWQGSRKRPFVCHYDKFLFPLDVIGNWNRMYGRRGFVQYQCVFPLEQSRMGLQAVLGEASRSRRSSFLGVLKRFGPEGNGLLSFPREGYTLTLDFPVSDQELFPFLDHLDEIVLQHSGRVYLAKDARMSAQAFRRMYPRLDQWLEIKSRVDPNNRFDSDLAQRLELTSRRGRQ